MARIAPLLSALGRVQRRELGQFQALRGNHFLFFCAFLASTQPASATFLATLMGLVLYVPLSLDPLRRVPPDRAGLLPLGPFDRLRVRLASLALSPLAWLAAGLLAWGGRRHLQLVLLMLAGALALNLSLPLLRRLAGPRRLPPPLPGSLGILVRKNLRELLQLLDPYLALVLALVGTWHRATSPGPVPDALFGMTLLVLLAMSTSAQRLFALDGAGLERFRLAPIPGWRILLAKDLAFLILLVVLVLPLAPSAGLAGGLVALAVGHQPSVRDRTPQPAWRFVASSDPGRAFLQVLLMAVAAGLADRIGPRMLLPCAAAWGLSLGWFGRRLDHRMANSGRMLS